jgi:hypothetical protein
MTRSAPPCVRHSPFGEFQLGPSGFGSPDGGFLGIHAIHATLHKAFVFIEAKAVLERASFQDPAVVSQRIDGMDWNGLDEQDLARLSNANTINSSLNGQVELRWRFVNAFRQGPSGTEMLITEAAVPVLPQDILRTDRFYWRQRLRPQQRKALTMRQVQVLLAGVLARVLGCDQPERKRRTANRRLRRNEEAWFYHWKQRNRLPPRRFDQRT